MDEYVSRDRLLLAISDTTIHGTTRLQKYGFLLYKQYGKELSAISSKHDNLTFYDDWKPYWFGPYSESLSKDTKACVDDSLVYKDMVDPARNSYRYSLTMSGRMRWRKIMSEFHTEMTAIREKIMNLQKMRLERLLQGVYDAYPEYTKQSTIKDELLRQP